MYWYETTSLERKDIPIIEEHLYKYGILRERINKRKKNDVKGKAMKKE